MKAKSKRRGGEEREVKRIGRERESEGDWERDIEGKKDSQT